MARGQSTRPCHNSPPGEAGGRPDQVADGAGRSRETRLFGYFAIRHDLARFEPQKHDCDLLAEVLQGFLTARNW